VLLMIGGPWSSAMAGSILYTIEFVASGTVDSVPLTNERVVIAGVTDTGTATAIAQADLVHLQQLIADLSYSAGLLFTIASIIKFHQHKANPTQLAFAADVSFTSPLTKLVVQDGTLVTLAIDSILDNRIAFRTRHVAGGP